jgi:hypothetical protein
MGKMHPGRIFWVLLTLAAISTGGFSARAQEGTQVRLYGLQAASFPVLSAGMDAYDAAGNFVSGLQPADVTLLEDNQPRLLDKLEELQPGAQFVVALNTGPAFGRRDANAVTRLDTIRKSLTEWAASRTADNADDLSLVAVGAADSAHITTTGFLDALTAYQPEARSLVPSFDTLSRALDLAAASDPQSGKKSAVLFASSLPEPDGFAVLQSLTARAVQLKVRVFVWIVADEDQFTIAGATALKDTAIQTGGQATTFSGSEPLPSPETYLAPLRHTYSLTYTSAIPTSGSHSLTVTVNTGGQSTSAEPLSFDLTVQPPNPILVTPPEQILRQPADEATTNLLAFLPTTQRIEMLVEFPDSHPRPLVRTALYVDGQKMAENSAAPFEEFSWDLGAYTSSGEHTLQVEVEDSLGLSQVSLGVPVTVTVLQPPRGLAPILKRNAAWIAGGAVLLAGGILVVILTAGRRKRRPKRKTGARSRNDPLTQPVPPEKEQRARSLRLARRVKPSPAYLIRLRPDGQAATAPPIPLHGDVVAFGNDPTKATNVLDDPSVAPLHARLVQGPDGGFTLTDEKSIAGTWVNYEQVSAPRRLQHGDVFHIGQISYRFMLHAPPEKAGPQVTPIKNDPR